MTKRTKATLIAIGLVVGINYAIYFWLQSFQH